MCSIRKSSKSWHNNDFRIIREFRFLLRVYRSSSPSKIKRFRSIKIFRSSNDTQLLVIYIVWFVESRIGYICTRYYYPMYGSRLSSSDVLRLKKKKKMTGRVISNWRTLWFHARRSAGPLSRRERRPGRCTWTESYLVRSLPSGVPIRGSIYFNRGFGWWAGSSVNIRFSVIKSYRILFIKKKKKDILLFCV